VAARPRKFYWIFISVCNINGTPVLVLHWATFTQSIYFQLNQPTRCSNFSSLLLDIYIQLNMFRVSSCPSSGATTTVLAASDLPSELGVTSAVGHGWASTTMTNSTGITKLRR
jgi:hypothetical protein